MSDPLGKSDSTAGPLFAVPSSTSAIAGAHAALRVGSWRAKILERLAERPSALFELAEHFNTRENRISGRLTELAADGLIERTGDRVNNPATSCPADSWRVRRAIESAVVIPRLVDAPASLNIDGDLYDLQPLPANDTYPGLPYARRANAGGVRLEVRVALVECEQCGRPLHFRQAGDVKLFECGNPRCGRVYKCRMVTVPGKAPILALVMDRG